MLQESILYISYSVTAITVSVILSLLFWNRRKVSGAKYMAIMMACASFWGFSDFFSDISSSYTVKIFWENTSYLGIAIIPVAWLFFALHFTGREKFLTRRNKVLLGIIPFITLLMVWTNDFNHLMVTKMDFVQSGELIVLFPSFGAWFWIHAIYSYLLLLTGTVILMKNLVALPQMLRNQSILMIFAILFPLVMNILYTFDINPVYPIDPTIISFTFTGILCFFGMFRYKLFEMIPLARNAVIEDMSGIMIVMDNQKHIIDMNTAAKDILCVKDEDFVGKLVYELMGEWSAYFTKYKDVLDAKEKISIDTGNGIKYFDLRVTPLYDNRNKVIGRSFILYDITALEEAIVDLEEARKLAEDANKAKSQFLATMSHEIRTPLSGIIGMTELLTSAKLTEEEQGYLQTVQSCAGSLLDIINDILDFSKIEAGKMDLEETDFNLKALIDTTIRTFYHQAKEKEVKLVCSIDRSIPEKLIGDMVKIKQILVNLIGNAFKFTETGRVEVTAERLQSEDQTVKVQFSVIDTGIGVPQEKLNNLFKSFQQVDSSTTRKYGGTGLGLAIVKDLVTLMGGHIDVESRLGEGSRFSFTVPFRIADKDAASAVSGPEIDFRNKNITVLLTEDSKVNQKLIAKLLENKDIKVDIAENGIEALRMLDAKQYDLILMDIQMPEMDGYETTYNIREQEAGTDSHIPIIALTANATEADRQECMAAGMDDFLTKPIKIAKLYACIYKHICRNA